MFSLLCFQSKLHLIFRSEDAWCASHTPERLSWKLHGMELKIIIRITLRKRHLQCHQAFPLSSKGNCKLDMSPAVCDKCTSCTHHPPLTSTCTHTCTHVGPRQASPFSGQGAVVAYQKSSHHFHTTRQYFLITWLGKVLRGMIWKKNYGKSAPWGPFPASFPPKTGLWRWVSAKPGRLPCLSVGREQRGEGSLLGFAVGHHTHDADHQQGDADASDGQHPLLVELLCFWKGTRAHVTKAPDPCPDSQSNSWHAT